MIFDEPHSNLDNKSMEGLAKLINEYLKDCTVICVTHSSFFSENFEILYEITDCGQIVRRR